MEGTLRLGLLAALLLVGGGLGYHRRAMADTSQRRLTVVIKEREARVVDLAPAGPSHGDLRVVNGSLYNAQGAKVIGDFAQVCTVTDPADEPREPGHIAQCLSTVSLPTARLPCRAWAPSPRSRRCRSPAHYQGEQAILTFQLILRP